MEEQVRYVMQPLVSWLISRPYMRETFRELERRVREVLERQVQVKQESK